MSAGTASKIVSVLLAAVLVAGCAEKSVDESIAVAQSHLTKRDPAAAVIEMKSALQRSPESNKARYMLGVALLEQGDTEAALFALNKAQEQGFSEDLLAPKLSRAWLLTGKAKQVVQTYANTRLTSNSAQAELSTAVAVAYGRLNRRAEADAAVADALSADSKYPWALLTKARFVAAGGKFDEALDLVGQAIVPGAPSGEAYMLRGLLLRYAKRDEAAAFKSFEQAAQDPKEEMGARSLLIDMLLQRQKLDEAKGQSAALQKTYPNNAQAMYMDGVVAYAAKDFARSELLAEQLLRVSPDNAKILVLAGASNLQRGALMAAETKLGKVVQTVQGVVGARILLAETYVRMGQTDKSLRILKPLVDRPQPDPSAVSLAAQAHLYAGNVKEAEAMFTLAASLRPEDLRVQTSLALMDLAKGNAATAFDALQAIAAKDPGDMADLALISARMRRREFDAALAGIAALEKKSPGKPAVPHLRGQALLGKGDRVSARAGFEAALRIEPGHFASTAALAMLDEQENKPAAARQRLEDAIKANPKNTAARMALLDAMLRQKAEPAELLANIDQAIQAEPSEPSPRLAKIVQLSRAKDVKGAALAAQQAIAALPNDLDILDAAGLAFSSAGDEQQAISTFNKQASIAPGSARAHLRLASVYAKRGDGAAVAASLNRAFEIEPLSVAVHDRLMAQAVRSKDFKAVVSAAKELQKKFEQRPAGYELEGDIHAALGRWDQAAGSYRAALKRTPATAMALKVVRSLARSSDPKAADAFAKGWLAEQPRDAAFHAYMGDRARGNRDFAAAERHYLAALQYEPNHAGVLNNVAWVIGQTNKARAIPYAEKAIELRPNLPDFMDTLAQLLASTGQRTKAIELERKALAVRPGDAQIKLALARMLLEGGDRREAQVLLLELSKLGSAFPAQTDVQALLKQGS